MNWDLAQYIVEGENEKEFGRYVLEPLPKGISSVVGNALRRLILSAVPGAAVTAILIDGVVHEFSTLPGLYEDVPDLVLNMREVIFKVTGQDVTVVKMESQGPCEIFAKDLILPLGVEVLNPEHYICRINRNGSIHAEIYVGIGRGFVPEEENKDESMPINTIFVNSNFSPISKVNYRTEVYENDSAQERLIIDVKTNGSVSPTKALKIGAVYLNKVLGIMKDFEEFDTRKVAEEEMYPKTKDTKNVLELHVSELGLSRRSSNCLKAGEITLIGQLAQMSKNDLMNLKNFGKKSLDEIREKLHEYGLSLKDEQLDETDETDKDIVDEVTEEENNDET
ncbi:MAG: DNA-directed RNA polymerase subunit alpha [Candidatus Wallbacteria bacterium]|nr:DNA-directed RNA polymerase subunit alpha [Candidatus Wallbacteria bacterium]